MKITSGRNPLAVGVDYREEYPKVCYQSIQMKEAHFCDTMDENEV